MKFKKAFKETNKSFISNAPEFLKVVVILSIFFLPFFLIMFLTVEYSSWFFSLMIVWCYIVVVMGKVMGVEK